MRYRITLLDHSQSTIAVLTGLTSAQFSEKINGCGILSLETVERSVWPLVVPGASFIRVTDTYHNIVFTCRVLETDMIRDRERRTLKITARHILYDTASELVAEVRTCIRYTPEQLMTAVLAHSSYESGIIEPQGTIPFIRFEYDTVLHCLERISALTGGELRLNEDTGQIDLLTQRGEDNGAVFRYGVNLKKTRRRISMSRIANRVYGIGGGDPPLLLDGATESGGMLYAENPDSITAYGLFEGVCHEPVLEQVENYIETPAFDGVYTSGLCENWNIIGTPTLSKNIIPDFILYGTSSQRIQGNAAGDGISQTVSVIPGTIYSLSATLFLATGSVWVKIMDGTVEYHRQNPVTGTGFITIEIENWKANSSTITISICQSGGSAMDVYIDSVQLAKGAHTLPFSTGKSADTLWDRTMEVLESRKHPDIIYDIDLVDRSEESKREDDRFRLGDTVRVIDSSLGFDVHTRVMERSVDLLQPWRVSVRLDSTTSTLADVLAALRNAQQEGIRFQRASYAAGSNAAEAGSSRLGFSNLAFRFFGEVTSSSYNSITWTAGILRVGVSYFTINAGGFSGLPTSSTRYVYFDRTNPDTFGITDDPAETETEDRILIFAITSFTSPTLPSIHPLGLIHS